MIQQIKTINNEPMIGTLQDPFYKHRQAVTMTINLQLNQGKMQKGVDRKDYYNPVRLSISASVWNHRHTDITSGGQMNDSLRKDLKEGKLKLISQISESDFTKLLDIWDRWHLNDMCAGTAKQNEVLRLHGDEEQYSHLDKFLDRPKQVLKDYNLEPDNGYSYGSAWLYEPLPQDVIDFIKMIQIKLGMIQS